MLFLQSSIIVEILSQKKSWSAYLSNFTVLIPPEALRQAAQGWDLPLQRKSWSFIMGQYRVISKNSLINSSRRSALSSAIDRYFSRNPSEICSSSRRSVRYPITEVSGVDYSADLFQQFFTVFLWNQQRNWRAAWGEFRRCLASTVYPTPHTVFTIFGCLDGSPSFSLSRPICAITVLLLFKYFSPQTCSNSSSEETTCI